MADPIRWSPLLRPSVVVVSLLISALLLSATLAHASGDTNADRVAALLERQSRSPDGVIRFDDASLRYFVQQAGGNSNDEPPRPYSLVIFFDAVQLHDNADLRLKQLRSEFGLLASSYIRHNQGTDSASKVFFVDLEFKQSQQGFSLFQVQALPRIAVLLPSTFPRNADPMDPSDISRGAEGMASFVESRTKHKVGPIQRPPPISKKQIMVLIGGLIAIAPFVIKRVMAGNTPLHNPKVWAALALFVYYFSVSGGMYNIIRGMPLFIADRNNPGKLVFFYQGSGMQFGAEGFIVGFMYLIFGLMMAFLTHFLVLVKNQKTQRLVAFICMLIGFWSVRKVIFLDNWKTGYHVHGYWPNSWR